MCASVTPVLVAGAVVGAATAAGTVVGFGAAAAVGAAGAVVGAAAGGEVGFAAGAAVGAAGVAGAHAAGRDAAEPRTLKRRNWRRVDGAIIGTPRESSSLYAGAQARVKRRAVRCGGNKGVPFREVVLNSDLAPRRPGFARRGLRASSACRA